MTHFGPGDLEQAMRPDPDESSQADVNVRAAFLLLLVGPLLCVFFWAFFTRGGLTFRLTGLDCCGPTAVPPCGCSVPCALLFWLLAAPVLLGLSIWLERAFPRCRRCCSGCGVLPSPSCSATCCWPCGSRPARCTTAWWRTYLVPR